MKTIFITSFHTLISRNILATGLLKILAEKNRIVIFAPELKKEYFLKEFSARNIIIEGIEGKSFLSRKDIFFHRLRLFLTLSGSMRIKRKSEMLQNKKFLLIFSELPSLIFGRSHLFLRLFRFLDYYFPQGKVFKPFFEKYQPSLIFSTDLQNQVDEKLLQEARGAGIKTIGMVRSWDNLTTKGIFRVFPNWLIVNNELLKKEAIKYNDFPAENIFIVGIPHYDKYTNLPKESKENFFKEMEFDASKKTILFSPIGDRYIPENAIDKIVLEALADLDVNILVRQPPGDSADFEGFKTKKAKIFIDYPGTRFWKDGAKTNELSGQDDDHLIASLFFSDVVVAGPSTMCIDAAIFNKPVILINFDSGPRQYQESISRYWDYDHVQPIIKSRGARLVNQKSDLLAWVEKYLADSHLDNEGRKRIIDEQCWKTDGQSTKRLADCIVKVLDN